MYSPNHVRFEYNLDLSKKEVLVYLGTYFPRSFVETSRLFADLFEKTTYNEILNARQTLNVLDFGCGTGGEIFGLLSVVEKYLANILNVKILAIDGNHEALRVFEKVMSEFQKHTQLNISYNIAPVFIENEEELDIVSDVIQDSFQIILTCKAVCEIISKKRIQTKAYKHVANMLSKKLTRDGLFFIEDVTVKNSVTSEFLPYTLNSELNEFVRENPSFSTIYPVTCANHELVCTEGCFFKKEFCLSHSEKKKDTTKVVYRMIGYKDIIKNLKIESSELNTINCNL